MLKGLRNQSGRRPFDALHLESLVHLRALDLDRVGPLVVRDRVARLPVLERVHLKGLSGFEDLSWLGGATGLTSLTLRYARLGSIAGIGHRAAGCAARGPGPLSLHVDPGPEPAAPASLAVDGHRERLPRSADARCPAGAWGEGERVEEDALEAAAFGTIQATTRLDAVLFGHTGCQRRFAGVQALP